jgi:hypothetical protein
MCSTDRRLHGNPRFLVRYPFARNPLVSRRNFSSRFWFRDGMNVVKNGAVILFDCFICCDVASGCPVLLLLSDSVRSCVDARCFGSRPLVFDEMP